ncbi:hypothetical protein Pcinc_029243 [Petrolisthes cinctipes]|uniref:Uncharacterized protein n=1 Tax=Petrolisthes cinctipes TaxID=88211 RepID=A0AAE1F1Y4_PETCI|nr:hypothetical protein Pcinc_029243 [Petrolisthes cinctipes]
METWKQMSNYSLSWTHGGTYPVPSTILVLATELTKLILVLAWAVRTRARVKEWRPCVKLSAPAFCYFVTNLLYLLALRSTPPPLWMVLIQTRTLYTALAYLVVFGREVSMGQIGGCLLVVVSLPLAHASELQAGRSSITTLTLLFSQMAALLSTVASLIVEMALKNDLRSVVEQQVWLYLWGSLLALLSLAVHSDLSTLAHLKVWSVVYVLTAVVSSALAGLCVPFIIKNLDTIAKDYLAALNNTLVSVVTAVLFPLSFTFNPLYLASLVVLLSGIWLYERKESLPCQHSSITTSQRMI